MQVAQHLLAIAHVFVQQAQQALVRHAGLVELHRRDLESLLVDLAGAQRILGAADVGDMPDRAHEADELAVAEARA